LSTSSFRASPVIDLQLHGRLGHSFWYSVKYSFQSSDAVAHRDPFERRPAGISHTAESRMPVVTA